MELSPLPTATTWSSSWSENRCKQPSCLLNSYPKFTHLDKEYQIQKLCKEPCILNSVVSLLLVLLSSPVSVCPAVRAGLCEGACQLLIRKLV